jgi:hypothetical protein
MEGHTNPVNQANHGRNASSSYDSHDSKESYDFQNPDRLIPQRGDYKTLLSFQKAEIVYDFTFRFAHKYLEKGDRTIDQMIQSARRTFWRVARQARLPRRRRSS